MLRAVVAEQFIQRMGSGKTKPALLGCVGPTAWKELTDEAPSTEEYELVVKFSEGCERRELGLAAEALCAMFAADLDLPIPEPFLVRLEPEFVAAIPERDISELARLSLPWAFGSARLPPQFSIVPTGIPLPQILAPAASEVLAFDLLISNPDRRAGNPNCLTNGRSLAIYDHELALITEGILGWRPPWEEVRLDPTVGPHRHIFYDDLQGCTLDLSRLQGALEAVTPERIRKYEQMIPEEWRKQKSAIERMLWYIRELISHAPAAIQNIQTALK